MKKCEKGFFKACSKFIGKAAKIGANDRCYGLALSAQEAGRSEKIIRSPSPKQCRHLVCTAFLLSSRYGKTAATVPISCPRPIILP